MSAKSPIYRSVIFSLLELVIFLGMCALEASVTGGSLEFNRRFVSALSSGFVALVSAIAATWYVVFTYYLMKSTIEFNQRMSTPYISIAWEISAENPIYKAANCYRFALTDRQDDGLQPAKPIADTKWATVVITNVRAKPIDRISIKVSVVGGSDTMMINPKIIEGKFERLRLERDQTMTIAVADVLLVPKDVALRFDVKSIQYQANDSNDIYAEYSGNSTFVFAGSALIVPANIQNAAGSIGGLK